MKMIAVRAVAGRVAYDAPRGGKRIPTDKWTRVHDTPWIRRLIEEHGDLEVEPVKGASASAEAQAKKKD